MFPSFKSGIAWALAIMPLHAEVLETNFESGFGPWTPLFSGTWEIQNQSGNHVAALTVAGVNRPPVRRPQAYLFLNGYSWTDCTFTVHAKTLEPAATTTRDVVLIFGYADDTHYYYAHTSSKADAIHTVIMKVAGTQRATIHLEANPTPALNGNWQTIRVEHAATGTIRVFVDNMVTPRLTANDTTYPAGALAFGSFDDRALFDDVSISGTDIPVTAPKVSLEKHGNNELTLSYPTQKGLSYQLLSGSNLSSLTPLTTATAGSGSMETRPVILAEAPYRFFQVLTTHPLLAQP
ncbi:hypothetical protein [Luteolibacter soli]|uniref:DUF1080 domain-containing protein n=1 Tax=Luteolibacter soli TaxID=3135280 RepID=A0ABU9ASQ2_9BACT